MKNFKLFQHINWKGRNKVLESNVTAETPAGLTRYDQHDGKLFVEDLIEKIFLVKSVG